MNTKKQIAKLAAALSKATICAMALSITAGLLPAASTAQAQSGALSSAASAKSISGAWKSRNKALPEGVAAGYPIQLSSTDWMLLSAGQVEKAPIDSYQQQKDAIEKVINSNRDVFAYAASRRFRPPLTAQGQTAANALQAAREPAGPPRNPYDQCLPKNTVGVSADSGFGRAIEIFGADDHIGVVSEGGDFRVIHMNKNDASTYTPAYNGVSLGHWEGSKLVVVTTNFLGDTAEGWPMSPQAKITDTIWSADGKTLNIKTVYEDATMLKEPVARMTYLDRAPLNYEFLPVSCVETVQGAAEYAATFGTAPPK